MIRALRSACLIAATLAVSVPAWAELPAERPEGALAGATIYLSPGHGWYPHDRLGWILQRGNTHGVVEDLSNSETVIQYLLPLLENAGADVRLARERCFNTNEVIIDASDATFGDASLWETERVDLGTRNGSHMIAPAGVPGATATFNATIPEDGQYAVYAWYRPPVDKPAAEQARLTVRHSGGETTVLQDLSRDGYTWRYIGSYWFEAGTDAASVTISGTPLDRGRYLSIEAVRFGGGMGSVPAPDGSLSGKPRWEESGWSYSQFLGFDPEVQTRRFNQVWAMPMWAEWDSEPYMQNRSIYVSWHTNGSIDHQKSGISTYIYSPNAWGPPREFAGFPGGDRLAHHTHFSILNAVRRSYDPDWNDVGIITRWLGETNPTANMKMPAVLLENGFHDFPGDARYILDPRFRAVSARATYHGILDYFANEVDGFDNATRLPEPPTHFRIIKRGMNEIELAWNAPPHRGSDPILGDAATSYRVYRSTNGKGFDNGTPVDEPSFIARNVPPNTVVYFRVTAVNQGGESLHTETLAVNPTELNRPTPVLLVNGFNRLDGAMNLLDSETIPGTTFQRGMLDRMNSFDYSIQLGTALRGAGWKFDSASNEAVRDGIVSLGDYQFVVWAAGREIDPPSTAERNAMREFVAAGGNLLLTGENMGEALARIDTALLTDTFGASLRAPNANANDFTLAGPLAQRNASLIPFGRAGESVYLVNHADALSEAGGRALASFPRGGHAIIGRSLDNGGRALITTVPLETIPSNATRTELMVKLMAWLNSEME